MCMVHLSHHHHLCGAWLGVLWVCGSVCSPPHTPQGFNYPIYMSHTWQPHKRHVACYLKLLRSSTIPWKHFIWQSCDFSSWIHLLTPMKITSYGVFLGLHACMSKAYMHLWAGRATHNTHVCKIMVLRLPLIVCPCFCWFLLQNHMVFKGGLFGTVGCKINGAVDLACWQAPTCWNPKFLGSNRSL